MGYVEYSPTRTILLVIGTHTALIRRKSAIFWVVHDINPLTKEQYPKELDFGDEEIPVTTNILFDAASKPTCDDVLEASLEVEVSSGEILTNVSQGNIYSPSCVP
jgi:hypothetical protein